MEYTSCYVSDEEVISISDGEAEEFSMPVGYPRDREWVMGMTLGQKWYYLFRYFQLFLPIG